MSELEPIDIDQAIELFKARLEQDTSMTQWEKYRIIMTVMATKVKLVYLHLDLCTKKMLVKPDDIEKITQIEKSAQEITDELMSLLLYK
jgi:hypothetical protein